MNKELTPLEALKYLDDIAHGREMEYDAHELKIIVETALKEKEQQDNALKILKEIIKFSTMLPHIEPNEDNSFNVMSAVGINIQRDIENKERELLRKWVLETCFPKELKALEIIKEKRVNVWCVSRCSLEEYNTKFVNQDWRKITQEEFDLLKEVVI